MNWWTKFIDKLFLVFKGDSTKEKDNLVREFDAIWLKKGDDIYDGFVYEKTRRRILVTYFCGESGFKEVWFPLTTSSKTQVIKKDDMILYFEKPCSTD